MLIPTLFCPKPWEEMTGDETQRFCRYCKKHVHNLQGLSLNDRLALLTTPAASLCGRYQIAIRRPTKGREAQYRRHLLKYGASVALTGSVLVVLWEWYGREQQEKYYVAAGISPAERGMPRRFYREQNSVMVGMLGPWVDGEDGPIVPVADVSSIAPAGLKLDATEVDRMMRAALPKPAVEKPVVPLEK
jgi:hypothetical protein